MDVGGVFLSLHFGYVAKCKTICCPNRGGVDRVDSMYICGFSTEDLTPICALNNVDIFDIVT